MAILDLFLAKNSHFPSIQQAFSGCIPPEKKNGILKPERSMQKSKLRAQASALRCCGNLTYWVQFAEPLSLKSTGHISKMTHSDIEFLKSTSHPVNWQGWSLECTLHSPAAGRPLVQHPKKSFKGTRVLKPPHRQHTWQPRTLPYLHLSSALPRRCSERERGETFLNGHVV